MNSFTCLIIFLSLLIHHKIFYNLVSKKYNLTKKQKSYILSFKNATTLSVFAIILNFYNIFFKTTFTNISILCIIYFTSYLVSDLIIGYKEYKEHLHILDSYLHHVFYIILNVGIILFKKNIASVYILFFLAEIPTSLFGYWTLFKKKKHKEIYSNLFLIFRILFLIVMTIVYSNFSLIKYITIPVTFLHIYWYTKSIKD